MHSFLEVCIHQVITYNAAASALEKAARGCVWVCVCVWMLRLLMLLPVFAGFLRGDSKVASVEKSGSFSEGLQFAACPPRFSPEA